MMNDELIRCIQAVVETESAICHIELSYEEGDMGHSVGGVYGIPRDPVVGTVPRTILTTNDGLSVLWASQSNALWVASMSGHVATTAAVQWPLAKGLIYRSHDPMVPWTVTALPPVRATGIAPNVTALWGIDDQNVFAGTYGGHIYSWNGTQWIQVYQGPEEGLGTIRAFGGDRADNVFAVGQNGVLLHFNGASWRQLVVPGNANGRENFTGIHTYPNGEVIISANGSQGRLLHGTANGLMEIVRTPIQLIGLVVLGERVLLATGDGVAELFGNNVQMIKSNFSTTSVWPGRGRVFFLEPAPPASSYVEHDPRNTSAPSTWQKRTF
jgi:hypothetical protein